MSLYDGPPSWVAIHCDATGCSKSLWESTREAVIISALAAGWSFWRSRSMRHYCADHGPRPNRLSMMTYVTDWMRERYES